MSQSRRYDAEHIAMKIYGMGSGDAAYSENELHSAKDMDCIKAAPEQRAAILRFLAGRDRTGDHILLQEAALIIRGLYSPNRAIAQDLATPETIDNFQQAWKETGNRKVATKALDAIERFMPTFQRRTMLEGLRGEEWQFFADKACEMADIIGNMLGTHESRNVDDPVVGLHYFVGGADWWIVEKDVGSPDDPPEEQGIQWQAWGVADIGYGRETGYICLPEIFEARAELDLHFKPVKLSELMERTHKRGI